jgi:hypothetical protein
VKCWSHPTKDGLALSQWSKAQLVTLPTLNGCRTMGGQSNRVIPSHEYQCIQHKAFGNSHLEKSDEKSRQSDFRRMRVVAIDA